MTLYYTGMREGEILALTPADVDLEKQTITISKSYQRLDGKDVITSPKTPKSDRTVTIPQVLCDCLKQYGCQASGVKSIRVHDLRHPYVKHTTKKYNSEKQKTQTTNLSADSLGFLFLLFILRLCP